MKKLKQKFKRALAAFLREELMEYIGYNHKIPLMSLNDRFVVDSYEFETMVMEFEVPIDMNAAYQRGNPFLLEEEIDRCKKQMADELINHIHVDAQNLTTHQDYMRRSVRFLLRIQTRKK